MIKKMSIKFKLFLCFAFVVILVLFTIWTLNTVVLGNYYLSFKEKSLAKIYNNINTIYSKNPDASNIRSQLEEIEINQNLDIVIKDHEKITVYSTSKDFSNNMFFVTNYANIINSDYLINRLSGDTKYFSEVIHDNRIQSDFVTLFRETI